MAVNVLLIFIVLFFFIIKRARGRWRVIYHCTDIPQVCFKPIKSERHNRFSQLHAITGGEFFPVGLTDHTCTFNERPGATG